MKITVFYDLKGSDKGFAALPDLLRVTVLYTLHGKLHVGLSGTEPYIPDQNVRHNDLFPVFISNIQVVRPSRLHRRQDGFKSPLSVCNRYIFFSQKGKHHFSSRSVKAPDFDLLFLLQDHPVTDQSWQS